MSISADSTSMLISAITFIISTTRPGLSAVSMQSRLEKTANRRGLCKLFCKAQKCDYELSFLLIYIYIYLLFGPSSFTCMWVAISTSTCHQMNPKQSKAGFLKQLQTYSKARFSRKTWGTEVQSNKHSIVNLTFFSGAFIPKVSPIASCSLHSYKTNTGNVIRLSKAECKLFWMWMWSR